MLRSEMTFAGRELTQSDVTKSPQLVSRGCRPLPAPAVILTKERSPVLASKIVGDQ
jgi:hypothetical protein